MLYNTSLLVLKSFMFEDGTKQPFVLLFSAILTANILKFRAPEDLPKSFLAESDSLVLFCMRFGSLIHPHKFTQMR
jgi:hypothetical protein